jgi:hypothetical protein
MEFSLVLFPITNMNKRKKHLISYRSFLGYDIMEFVGDSSPSEEIYCHSFTAIMDFFLHYVQIKTLYEVHDTTDSIVTPVLEH